MEKKQTVVFSYKNSRHWRKIESAFDIKQIVLFKHVFLLKKNSPKDETMNVCSLDRKNDIV